MDQPIEDSAEFSCLSSNTFKREGVNVAEFMRNLQLRLQFQ